MNIAVLGKNHINEMLRREYENAQFSLSVLEDIGAIKSIKGSKGGFVIKTAEAVIEASYIVVTAEPGRDETIAQQGALMLADDAGIGNLKFDQSPVAFVLDYSGDSSAQSTRQALDKALRLAQRKLRVTYLAKNIRTAGDGLESLYRDTRRAGVLFHKYDDITIESSESSGFYIRTTDSDGGMEMDARTVIFDGEPEKGGAYQKLMKLLRVKIDDDGISGKNAFHLFPSLTSRAGIYLINPNAASGGEDELLAQVRYILSDIRRDMWNTSAAPEAREALSNPDGYAEVDTEKCAFCYTCYRACPHAAMTPDNEKSAMRNLKESCKGCGICFSVCPANAITMKGRKQSVSAGAAGSVNVFCCENSGELAMKKIVDGLKTQGIKVSVTPTACGGEITVESLLKALGDTDRVLVAVCMDDACRHFDGNKRARREVERAKEMLKATGLDEGRITYLQLSHAMPVVLEEYINDTAAQAAEEMGI
jgi:Fe-S-cluster-containing hydrogenase component 2